MISIIMNESSEDENTENDEHWTSDGIGTPCRNRQWIDRGNRAGASSVAECSENMEDNEGEEKTRKREKRKQLKMT